MMRGVGIVLGLETKPGVGIEHTAVDARRRTIEQMAIIELKSRFRCAHVEHASLDVVTSRLASSRRRVCLAPGLCRLPLTLSEENGALAPARGEPKARRGVTDDVVGVAIPPKEGGLPAVARAMNSVRSAFAKATADNLRVHS
jgi:hypothetical protein